MKVSIFESIYENINIFFPRRPMHAADKPVRGIIPNKLIKILAFGLSIVIQLVSEKMKRKTKMAIDSPKT
jgi:hypothetical protein